MPGVPFIPYEQRDPWSQRYYKLIRQDEHRVTDEMILSAWHAYLKYPHPAMKRCRRCCTRSSAA